MDDLLFASYLFNAELVLLPLNFQHYGAHSREMSHTPTTRDGSLQHPQPAQQHTTPSNVYLYNGWLGGHIARLVAYSSCNNCGLLPPLKPLMIRAQPQRISNRKPIRLRVVGGSNATKQ